MPIRNFAKGRWAQPDEWRANKVVAFKLPTRRRARNVQTLRSCPVCGRYSSPLAHDALVCAAKHGFDGNAVYVMEHRNA